MPPAGTRITSGRTDPNGAGSERARDGSEPVIVAPAFVLTGDGEVRAARNGDRRTAVARAARVVRGSPESRSSRMPTDEVNDATLDPIGDRRAPPVAAVITPNASGAERPDRLDERELDTSSPGRSDAAVDHELDALRARGPHPVAERGPDT